MECKDMNMEEAMELCRQEYEKERTCSFWTKYFTPYTYSFMRRIDERMRLPYFRNLLQ